MSDAVFYTLGKHNIQEGILENSIQYVSPKE
jgi:hypothetical protein